MVKEFGDMATEENMFMRGKKLEEQEAIITNCIKSHATQCKDEIVNMNNLLYNPGEKKYLLLKDGAIDTLEVERHAETQLMGRLQIPATYIYKCPEELKASNVNYWIERFGKKKIMLRYYGSKVRAIFSSKYSTQLDDVYLFPIVISALKELYDDSNGLDLTDFVTVGDFTLLQILFNNISTVYNGETYTAGCTIVNSEVGKSSIHIKPLIHIFNPNNTYTFMDRSQDGSYNIRHIGELKTEKVQEAVKNAMKSATVGIYRLMETDKEIVENPVEEIKTLVENSDFLTFRMTQVIEEEYKDQQNISRLKLAKTMLTAIKELPLFKRYLAEQEVGRYLNLFNDTDPRFNYIVEDLQQLNQIEL